VPASDGVLFRLVVKALEREDMAVGYCPEFENPIQAR
jgi:hypothetical protein